MNRILFYLVISLSILFCHFSYTQTSQKSKPAGTNTHEIESQKKERKNKKQSVRLQPNEFYYWGVSFGFATDNAISGDIFYTNLQHHYHLGISWYIDSAKGAEKTERKSNYGLTTRGSGIKYYTVDFKYGYEILDSLEMFADISIGNKKYYTNYIDNRFNDGGYHLINDSELIFGLGVGANYRFSSNWGIYVCYNSITKINIGISYLFNRIL